MFECVERLAHKIAFLWDEKHVSHKTVRCVSLLSVDVSFWLLTTVISHLSRSAQVSPTAASFRLSVDQRINHIGYLADIDRRSVIV